jgi:peptidoglycan/LPS O-acetylase OafA/YrhL
MAVIDGFRRFEIANTKPLGDFTIIIISLLVSYIMIRLVSNPIEKIRARRVAEKKQVTLQVSFNNEIPETPTKFPS